MLRISILYVCRLFYDKDLIMCYYTTTRRVSGSFFLVFIHSAIVSFSLRPTREEVLEILASMLRQTYPGCYVLHFCVIIQPLWW